MNKMEDTIGASSAALRGRTLPIYFTCHFKCHSLRCFCQVALEAICWAFTSADTVSASPMYLPGGTVKPFIPETT